MKVASLETTDAAEYELEYTTAAQHTRTVITWERVRTVIVDGEEIIVDGTQIIGD